MTMFIIKVICERGEGNEFKYNRGNFDDFIEKNITLNRAMFVMEYVHLWRKHEKTKDIFKK